MFEVAEYACAADRTDLQICGFGSCVASERWQNRLVLAVQGVARTVPCGAQARAEPREETFTFLKYPPGILVSAINELSFRLAAILQLNQSTLRAVCCLSIQHTSHSSRSHRQEVRVRSFASSAACNLCRLLCLQVLLSVDGSANSMQCRSLCIDGSVRRQPLYYYVLFDV